MGMVLKQAQEIGGSTSSARWGWKQIIYEYWETDASSSLYYINSNKSIVVVESYLGRTYSTTESFGGYATLNITANGDSRTTNKNFNYGSVYLSNGQYTKIQEETFEVEHEFDGTKTISVSSSLSTSQFTPNSASASGNITLSTIPRATDLPGFSAGYVEDTYTLALSPKINGARHSVKFRFGNTKGEAISDRGLTNWLQQNGSLGTSESKLSGVNLSVTFPIDYYNWFDGSTGYGAMTLYTYNGDTLVGEKTKWYEISCNPSRCSPQIEATAVDVNEKTLALTGNPNNIIANASHVLITPTIQISDSDDANATIISKKVNNIPFTTDTVTVVGPSSKYFDLTVTNSRNLPTSKTISATGNLVPYIALTFSANNLSRTEPTTGEIEISYSGNYYNGEFTDKTVTSSNLYVGNELSYSNITCAFPDNLWETMPLNTAQIIFETEGYELFYWSQGESEPTDTTEVTAQYAVMLESKTSTDQIVLYYATRYGTNEPVIDINSPDLIVDASFGILETVNDEDTIIYPYITKTTTEEPIINSLSLSWEYREKGSEEWTIGGMLSPSIDTEKNTYSGDESLGTIFDYKKQYEFRIKYEDKIISEYTEIKTVPRGYPVFWWGEDFVRIMGDLYVEGEINPTS